MMRHYKHASLLLMLAGSLLGCGEKSDPIVSQTPSPPAQQEKKAPTKVEDPLADLDIEATHTPTHEAFEVETLEGPGCVAASAPQRIWPTESMADLVVENGSAVVAGYSKRNGAEEVFVVRAPKNALPLPLRRLALPSSSKERTTPPAITPFGASYMVAVVDGSDVLHVAQVNEGGLRKVSAHVDSRFAPALSSIGAHPVLSWTQQGALSKLFTATFNAQGKETSRKEVTPSTGGGCAPHFVSDSVLLFVEPREAISILHRLDFTKEGAGTSKVVRPIANMFAPANIVGEVLSSELWVAFTATGQAAATAVGVVNASSKGGSPKAIVSSLAYGMLHLDAAASDSLAVFVAEVARTDKQGRPIDVKPGGPRSYVIRTMQNGTLSATVELPELRLASFAKVEHLSGSSFVLLYSQSKGTFVQQLNCR